VRTVRVVVVDELAKNSLELATVEDEDSVEAFPADSAHETLSEGIRPGRPYWGSDDSDSLGAEYVVEACCELGIPVADQNLPPWDGTPDPHHQVASLLGHPDASGIGGHASEVHPTTVELDEKQHVETSKEHGLHREEVTCQHAGCLGS